MIGTLLGNRYELVEKIGEGGMAEVFKAKDSLLNRFVAVKILKEEFSQDNSFVDKFKGEATAVASLSDNNIVNIYDVGSYGKINYIVMEYVDGKTLKQVINENGRLQYEDAVKIAIQIGKALDCAHRNNIIHRDIKPHNILVSNDGVIKVTDFGIAKASNSVTITNSSKVMGSAHYFSPEQARGSYVDFRTDIYSLGIVLYEMLCGKVPFDAESPVSIALKHIQETPPAPKNSNSSIPESLNALIMKSIEKEPIKRYQSIKEMISDLQKINNNEKLDIHFQDIDDGRTRVLNADEINNALKNSKVSNRNDADDEYDEDEEEEYDYDEDENDEEKENFGKRSKKKNKKNKKLIVGLAIGIVLVLVAVASSVIAMKKFAAPKNIVVPKIVGLSREDAKKSLEDKKLKFTEAGSEKNDKPEGTVLKCVPDEGASVKEGDEVRVIVSAGQGGTKVPDVRGMDVKSATEMLKGSGFKVKITSSHSDTEKVDNVMSQTPDPDTEAGENTTVELVVSSGPQVKTVKVPDLSKMTEDQARNALANAKLKLGNVESTDTSDKSNDGRIYYQNVESGTEVKEGSGINVKKYVYKEEKATVPTLYGKTVNEASSLLSSSHLQMGSVDYATTTDKGLDGTVKSQSIEPGKQVSQGTSVNVVVYKFKDNTDNKPGQ